MEFLNGTLNLSNQNSAQPNDSPLTRLKSQFYKENDQLENEGKSANIPQKLKFVEKNGLLSTDTILGKDKKEDSDKKSTGSRAIR